MYVLPCCCCLFGFNVAFINFSIISRQCLVVTESSMLTFIALPHWSIMPQTLHMIQHPVTLTRHWVLTLSAKWGAAGTIFNDWYVAARDWTCHLAFFEAGHSTGWGSGAGVYFSVVHNVRKWVGETTGHLYHLQGDAIYQIQVTMIARDIFLCNQGPCCKIKD